MKKFFYLFLVITIASCSSQSNEEALELNKDEALIEGHWLMTFRLSEENIVPINFSIIKKDSSYQVEFSNAEEKILVQDVNVKDDEITIYDPVFNSWFEAKIVDSKHLKGKWFKDGKDYKIPFTAKHDESLNRFALTTETNNNTASFDGKWEVDFSKNNKDDHYKALGLFHQEDDKVTGTFITETGDYRFLEGNAFNDSLFLSCFDGSHLFLFKAAIINDSLIGTFWSGTHWEEPWVAVMNESFELSNPDSLTYLKEGYSELAFTFPDLNGQDVSLDDEKYKGKVVIVNIMGPWCPNCRDETAYLSDLYNRNHEKGLEVIALSFNKSEEFDIARDNVLKIKTFFDAEYDFLIAGKANKIAAAKSLPMLNHVMSYPTSIVIGRDGQIRKIRTGFYGPGTGAYYTSYIEKMDSLISSLLEEE